MNATAGQASPQRRPRVSQNEATRRLVQATIELLETEPIPNVTTRRIAERAGLRIMAITRSFGDQKGLFIEVVRELARRFAAQMGTTMRPEQMMAPEAVLRSKLVAWLLDNGVDPVELGPDPKRPVAAKLDERQQAAGNVSPRTAAAMNALALLAVQGAHVFAPVHLLDDEALKDLAILIATVRNSLPEIEKRLGWDEPAAE